MASSEPMKDEASFVPDRPEGQAPEVQISDRVRRMEEALTRMAETQARFFEMQAAQPPLAPPVPPVPPAPAVAPVEAGMLIGKFTKMDPPKFSGTGGETEAEDWLKRIKQIFNVMEVTEEQKLKLATFMFTSEALHWWEATERLLTPVPIDAPAPVVQPIVTWAQFLQAFNEKYFSDSYQRQKREEFILLTQGRMTISEYDAKFNALSRFAPALVKTEKDKCHKFEMGLELSIKQRISSFQLEIYSQLIDKVKIAERNIQEAAGKREQTKKLVLMLINIWDLLVGFSVGKDRVPSLSGCLCHHTRFSSDRR